MDERLTTAVMCNNCGKLFGYIVSAIKPKTTPLQAVARNSVKSRAVRGSEKKEHSVVHARLLVLTRCARP